MLMTRRLILPLAAILLPALFTACANVYSDSGLITTIHEAIQAELAGGDEPRLNFSEVVPRYWDQLAIVPPYHDPEEAAETLGVDLERLRHTRIEARDDINVIAFLGEGHTVGMVEYPRKKGDFGIAQPILLDRDEAVFSIEQADGELRLRLLENH